MSQKYPKRHTPACRYIRRRALRHYLGIADAELTKLIAAGILTPVYFLGSGRAYFARAELIAAEKAGKIFRPKHHST